MIEYTHNDEFADLLLDLEVKLADTEAELVRSKKYWSDTRLARLNSLFVELKTELADKEAEIANLTIRLDYALAELRRLEGL